MDDQLVLLNNNLYDAAEEIATTKGEADVRDCGIVRNLRSSSSMFKSSSSSSKSTFCKIVKIVKKRKSLTIS